MIRRAVGFTHVSIVVKRIALYQKTPPPAIQSLRAVVVDVRVSQRKSCCRRSRCIASPRIYPYAKPTDVQIFQKNITHVVVSKNANTAVTPTGSHALDAFESESFFVHRSGTAI